MEELLVSVLGIVVAIAIIVAIAWPMISKHCAIGSILIGMDGIVEHIRDKGFHATAFLTKKWMASGDIPIRHELDRYFTTSLAINKWLHKNRKNLEKL